MASQATSPGVAADDAFEHGGEGFNAAAALLRAGRSDEALNAFDAALRAAPEHAPGHHGRGLALHRLGARDAALEAFRTAVRLAPDAWKSWRSIAEITPDEPERMDAVAQTAEALMSRCRSPGAAPDIFAACARALIDAHRYDEAAAFIRLRARRFGSLAAAYDLLARAFYRQGAFEAAFRYMQRALIAPDDRPAAIPQQRMRFEPDGAIAALIELWEILEAAGLRPFLAAGTLLGFYQSGAPLPHDRDVDVGILSSAEDTPDICGLLRRHPAVLLATSARPGERYFALTHKGIAADIFLYEMRGDHVLCGLSAREGDIQWRFSRFALAEVRYAGRDWRMPDAPERYLAESYGPGWQTPDKGYASAVSSPALHQVSPYTRAYYAAARARRARLAGDRVKAEALLDQSPLPVHRLAPGGPSNTAEGDRHP